MELAKTHRVLWINSVATRTPRLTSSRDLGKMARKLRAFARGPEKIHDNLWVYTPIVLPFPHSRLARALNKRILCLSVRMLRAQLGMDEFQLWTFLPNVVDYVGVLGEVLVVYYCTDEYSLFSYIDRDRTLAAEKQLCERADIIFAVCHSLVETKGALNPETHLSPHGVDQALFATALAPATLVPEDIRDLRGPILGFYGTIQDWVDQDLIAELAARRPEWTVVLIGGVHVDISRLERFANVHFLGRKPHKALPAYCKAFDVGLIPYVVDERMAYVNPIKLREYLSAGLPVVSTDVPEVAQYSPYCTVARNVDEFERGVIQALATDTPEARQERSEAMRAETWEARVSAVRAKIAAVMARKASRTTTDPGRGYGDRSFCASSTMRKPLASSPAGPLPQK